MASQGDRSESAHTLPRPELNPLLNPLLAENMGRWAEVYFTSPPEKREEAVLDLLRELEAEDPRPEGASSQTTLHEEPHAPDLTIPTTPFSEAEPVTLARCQSCGHDNPTTHTFCGMCGTRLEHEDDGVPPETPLPHLEASSEARLSAPPHAPADELSLLRSFSAHRSAGDIDQEPSPFRRYRFYFGAGLAIIILVVGYMAWSGGHATRTSHAAPSPPPATAADGGTTATPTTPSKPEEQPVSHSARKTSADSPMPTNTPSNLTAAKTAEGLPADSADTAAPSANGGAELAMAQHYLTGMNGQPRDAAEASKWLWKSMAKHNAEASLLLADLYLKGDGVSKNCDQARVLLDSAARKGMAAAGERLRNLQAFGCQ